MFHAFHPCRRQRTAEAGDRQQRHDQLIGFRQLVAVLQPPGPAGTDHTVGFRGGRLLHHPAAEFTGQTTGEPAPQISVIEQNHAEARSPQNQSAALFQQMLGIDLRVRQRLTAWCVHRQRLHQLRIPQRGGHIRLNISSVQLGFQSIRRAGFTEHQHRSLPQQAIQQLQRFQRLQTPPPLQLTVIQLRPAGPAALLDRQQGGPGRRRSTDRPQKVGQRQGVAGMQADPCISPCGLAEQSAAETVVPLEQCAVCSGMAPPQAFPVPNTDVDCHAVAEPVAETVHLRQQQLTRSQPVVLIGAHQSCFIQKPELVPIRGIVSLPAGQAEALIFQTR